MKKDSEQSLETPLCRLDAMDSALLCQSGLYHLAVLCCSCETESYKKPVNYKLVDINTCHPVSFPSLDYMYPMFVCACIFYEKYGGLTIVIPSVITASSTWFILTCLPLFPQWLEHMEESCRSQHSEVQSFLHDR